MKWRMVSLGLVTLIVALVGAWWMLGFKLAEMSALGDALAPLVGILSLAAVVAALYSVHLQSESLASQERSMSEQLQLQREAATKRDEQLKQQAQALAEQLQLQREALNKQDEQLNQQAKAIAEQLQLQREALWKQDEEIKRQAATVDEERTYRRQVALREAYAPLIVAVERYLDLVSEYTEWLRLNHVADKNQRRVPQQRIEAAYIEVARTAVTAGLLDGDKLRRDLRSRLCFEIRLESAIDVQHFQRDWCVVLHYEHLVRLSDLRKLICSLEAEFRQTHEQSKKGTITDFTLAKAKAAADEVVARVATNLKNRAAQQKVR